jgi:hypothetical protein
MADKKIKLKDLLKGSGFEEIPTKIFNPELSSSDEQGRKQRTIDLILPEKQEVVLKAGTTDDDRGLVVKWTNGKGYELYYWYGDTNKAVPSELIADGTSKGKAVKKVTLKYHAKPVDK